MIHNRSFVPMNPDKKEINELEHSPFDFIANEGNIHSYAASLIPSHWHRELEIFILLEGRVRAAVSLVVDRKKRFAVSLKRSSSG